MNLKYVIARKKDDLFSITLNRPTKCNAYNHDMALEITLAFKTAIESNPKMIVLSANGDHFCSGADLEWMKAARSLSALENIEDMRAIKNMFTSILHCPLPIVAFIQGSVRAGGMGIVSCCDFAFAQKNSTFALTELKWGLIPGIISPIVVRKIGKTLFESLQLEGTLLDTNSAIKIGLISDEYNSVDETIIKVVGENYTLSIDERIKFAQALDRTNELEDLLRLSAEARHRARF